MKLLLAICLLNVVSVAPSSHVKNFDLNVERHWASFKENYGKYYNNLLDELIRKEIFKKNLRDIVIHNMKYSRGLEKFSLDINQFADMTMEEFRASMLTLRVPENHQRNGSTFLTPLSLSDLPTEVDWRTKGFVTPIKDQGYCGSCWAFSATGSIEGQHARKTGKLVSLSEQNLVDCSRDFGNHGCGGGFPNNAFRYVTKNDGIDTEESYPYVAKNLDCTFKKESIGASITGYVDISKGSEKHLMEAVATIGPVSVAIDASHSSFKYYDSGIYYQWYCSTTDLNHAVLVIGYGIEDGDEYWLIKNSWGTKWGENGYMKMARNKDNLCGIASLASYPTV